MSVPTAGRSALAAQSVPFLEVRVQLRLADDSYCMQKDFPVGRVTVVGDGKTHTRHCSDRLTI
eukprot:5378709-Pleurochrysis_carterae.AAC.1